MKLYEILDSLQFEIENAANVPLTNKVMIDKDEILDLIDDLRAAIPADVEEARQIKESENRIKTKAAQEARSILDQANEHKAMLIDTNVITKNAYDEADAIIKDAHAEANRLRIKSIEYVASLLTKAQDDLKGIITVMDNNKNELKDKRKSLMPAKAQAQGSHPQQAQEKAAKKPQEK